MTRRQSKIIAVAEAIGDNVQLIFVDVTKLDLSDPACAEYHRLLCYAMRTNESAAFVPERKLYTHGDVNLDEALTNPPCAVSGACTLTAMEKLKKRDRERLEKYRGNDVAIDVPLGGYANNVCATH